MKKSCPICNNAAPPRLKKGNVEYCQCSSCGTLFSEPIDQEGMVGGGNEVPRNELQNHIRIARVDELVAKMKKEDVYILDYGAGHGGLVKDLKTAGYINTVGFDPYNPEFSKFPERNKYDIITCIEVIEHTSAPYIELDVMCRSLMRNGIVIFETSFVDVATEENIELENFEYICPEVGHSTLFSHWGFDLILAIKGFRPIQHWNRHCRAYAKR
jgi:hypothetical protein